MANGTITPSEAVWQGDIVIGGIRTHGEFEVFQSGGGWKFLFGKLLLRAFKAIHDYETDEVQVTGIGGTATLHNLTPAMTTNTVETNKTTVTQSLLQLQEPEDRDSEISRSTEDHLDTKDIDADPIYININGDPLPPHELDELLHDIPTDFLKDDTTIFTRLTDPHNPL